MKEEGEELTLRKIRFNNEYSINEKKKLEWLALSLGLINEKDNRKGIIAVLYALIHGFNINTPLTIEDINEKANKLHKMSVKTVYYHLKRLKERGIVRKMGNGYIIGDGSDTNLYMALSRIYKEKFNAIISSMEEGINSLQIEIKEKKEK